MIRQVSVNLKNQPGELDRIMEVLENAGHIPAALCITDTSENGILRMIFRNPEEVDGLLSSTGIPSGIGRVILLSTKEEHSLGGVFALLSREGFNVEYLYNLQPGCLIFKVQDCSRGEALLREAGFRVLEERDIDWEERL